MKRVQYQSKKALEEKVLRSNKIDAIGWLKNKVVRIESKSTKYLQERNKVLTEILNKAKVETNNRDMWLYMVLKEPRWRKEFVDNIARIVRLSG